MAETLVQIAKRLCKFQRHCSEQCPIWISRKGEPCILVTMARTKSAEEQIQALQDWAAAHPPKTYKDVLLEKFPDAGLTEDGSPMVCRNDIFCGGKLCPEDSECSECWNKPYEEEIEDKSVTVDSLSNGSIACESCVYTEKESEEYPCKGCVHNNGSTEYYRRGAK